MSLLSLYPSIYHSFAQLVTDKITSYIHKLDILVGAEDSTYFLSPSYILVDENKLNM